MPDGVQERTEYRVVGDPDSVHADPHLAGPYDTLSAAQRALREIIRVGMSVTWHNVRIQKSTVTRTPWVDYEETGQ